MVHDAHDAESFCRGPINRCQLIHWYARHHLDRPPRRLQISCGNPALLGFGVGPVVDWQGADQGDRPAFAARGKLPLRTPSRPGRLLADFNGRIPALAAAPDWARRPLSTERR
jgi:hypothetical protein